MNVKEKLVKQVMSKNRYLQSRYNCGYVGLSKDSLRALSSRRLRGFLKTLIAIRVLKKVEVRVSKQMDSIPFTYSQWL